MLALDAWLWISLGGLIAGAMNTLAGYGSIITLTILMEILGLPGNVANGTNRINILTNTVGGLIGFQRNGKLDTSRGLPIIIILTLGAILGIYTAIIVSNEQFRFVFKYLIIFLFIILLTSPKRWMRLESEDAQRPLWMQIAIFLPIGFYGGFIQMGMGIFFLAAAVLISKYNIIEANAIKLLGVTAYTLIGIIVFHFNGMIHWQYGLLLGISTFIGGYLTAHFASRYQKANVWAYRILVLIVLIVIYRTWFM